MPREARSMASVSPTGPPPTISTLVSSEYGHRRMILTLRRRPVQCRNQSGGEAERIMPKAVFYQSIGPELTRYDIDVDGAALIRRDAVTTPGANVQYVWPHPSKKFLYVVSSDGGPGTIPGTKHVATAFRIDPASGALTPHGGTAPLPSRPVHCSVDRSGEFLLTAYNYPSNITVHRIKPDGTLGEQVPPREKLDVGIFAHQVLTTPGNRTAIMVTRGNNPEATSPRTPARSRSMASRTAC